jgi:hypothetical protein
VAISPRRAKLGGAVPRGMRPADTPPPTPAAGAPPAGPAVTGAQLGIEPLDHQTKCDQQVTGYIPGLKPSVAEVQFHVIISLRGTYSEDLLVSFASRASRCCLLRGPTPSATHSCLSLLFGRPV